MIHLAHYRHQFAAMPRQAWIGKNAPDGMVAIDLDVSEALRAPAQYHNAFDVVWVFEQLLSDLPRSQWIVLMDEAIRLIGATGNLVVRHRQDDKISLMMVRNFLGRRPGLAVTMDPHMLEGDIINSVFHIKRSDLSEYRDTSWSFILLAQGNRTPDVINFLRKLKEIGLGRRYEVIIVGPRLLQYDEFDVRVLSKEYPSNHPQIAVKKNDAERFASHSNLCFLHDRFVLGDDFFTGFDCFGYDFDFVAVKQNYKTGEPYPFYGELSGGPMVWSVPIHVMDYRQARPTHFVNGGFMVFKRVMFDRIRFNPLLAWNEAEDVEISNAFHTHNIPPRINLFSTAITTVSTTHTAMFLSDSSAEVPSQAKPVRTKSTGSPRRSKPL